MPSPWSDSLKTETTQTELTQQPQPPRGAGSLRALSCPRHGACQGPGGPAGTGSSMGCRDTPTPSLLTCRVSHQLGAFWCLLLSQRELPSGAEAGGSSEPPPGGAVPSAGETSRHRSPKPPFGSSGKLFALHKDLLLFIPNLPSSAHQLVSTPLFKTSLLG